MSTSTLKVASRSSAPTGNSCALIIYIPFVAEKLRPEVRDLGERLTARFVHMPRLTSYWDLLDELWTAESFIVLEEDVLPTEDLIRNMWNCAEPWCSGTFGRWYGPELGPGHVLRSDSWLGCVKFGAIRRIVPDALSRAADHYPKREFWDLCRGIDSVLADEERLSPHLHFPPLLHLKEVPGSGPALPYRHLGDDGIEVMDPAWDQEKYERDLAGKV
jgi:hypothetical protein